jgi:hypothetical protein
MTEVVYGKALHRLVSGIAQSFPEPTVSDQEYDGEGAECLVEKDGKQSWSREITAIPHSPALLHPPHL